MNRYLKAVTILIFALFLVSFDTFGQQWGIMGGLNLSTMRYQTDNYDYGKHFSMRPSFHIGITYEAPINEFLSFQPAFMLTTKGYKYKYSNFQNTNYSYNEIDKVKTSYLEIPLTVKAFTEVGDIKIYGLFGPYLALGIAGKTKSIVKSNGNKNTSSSTISWGSDSNEDDLKRFDMGLTFGVGAQYSQYTFGISYDLGLTNIAAYQDNGNTIKNRTLQFSVGYLIAQ